ncbi:DUF4190 domain-containing protein [Promicromonospora sp. Marseille-Q5078]
MGQYDGAQQQVAPDPFAPPSEVPPPSEPPRLGSPPPGSPTPYSSYSPYPPSATGTDGVSIAALVTGLLFLGIVPLVLGIVGLRRVRRSGRPGTGLAVSGIVLGVVSILAWLVGVAFLAFAVNVLDEEGVLDDLGAELSRATATEYGDDPDLDLLYDNCSAGNDVACDDLYWMSPAGSEYEDFALSCGGREERCLITIGEE